MAPIIHLMRHAIGDHNVGQRWHLPDPDLTHHGEAQCYAFNDSSSTLQAHITHLVASPSYRCIRTALLSFGDVASRPGTLVIVNPDLQEVADDPCNIPLDQAALEDKADDYIDTTLLNGVNYTDRGRTSSFRAEFELVIERARKARVWLRNMTKQWRADHGRDAEVAVVSHGQFLKFLAQGEVLSWGNCQCRSYRFVHPDGDDDEATLELIGDGSDIGGSTGPSGGTRGSPRGGGGGPQRGILKRRRNDNNNNNNNPSPEGSSVHRTKKVGWARRLEHIREFAYDS